MNVISDLQRSRFHDAQCVKNPQIIVPTKNRCTWIRAWELSEQIELYRTDNQFRSNICGLPDHSLVDDYLFSSDHKSIASDFPIWTRNLLAYPVKNSVFRPKQDLIDYETRLGLPAGFFNLLDAFEPGTGLFIEPRSLDRSKLSHILWIVPFKILVLKNIVQNSSNSASRIYVPPSSLTHLIGQADPQTRIPVCSNIKGQDENTRFLARSDEGGIKPIYRALIHGINNVVYADGDWQDKYSLCFVLNALGLNEHKNLT